MRKIIDGRVYDTDTARLVCPIHCSYSQGDFNYEDTDLYKTGRGQYFLAGTGGPMTRWAQPEGSSGRRGGNGIMLIEILEAREIVEQNGTDEQWIAEFGEPEEG